MGSVLDTLMPARRAHCVLGHGTEHPGVRGVGERMGQEDERNERSPPNAPIPPQAECSWGVGREQDRRTEFPLVVTGLAPTTKEKKQGASEEHIPASPGAAGLGHGPHLSASKQLTRAPRGRARVSGPLANPLLWEAPGCCS